MEHVLDNPIWNGLLTGNRRLASGNQLAMFFPLQISICAGLAVNDEVCLEALYNLLPENRTVLLFSDQRIQLSQKWEVLDDKMLFQMIYKGSEPFINGHNIVKPLSENNIADMLTLTSLAQPGPFSERTFELGNYKGIFDDGKLIAMAGYRIQPNPYVEISAVCTHPDYLGRGYAASVINSLISDIRNEGHIPYLQVSQTNFKAVNLYKKMNFEIRSELIFYKLKRK